MPARPVVRALGVGALAVAAFWGCSFDWTVRPDPGADEDGTTPDARADALPDDGSSALDASPDRKDATPGDEDASVDCSALTAEAQTKLKEARLCSFQPGECSTTVKDECECDVVIARPSSAQTTAYVAVIAQIKAGCTPTCGTCPSTTGRGCLQEPSSVIDCFPP